MILVLISREENNERSKTSKNHPTQKPKTKLFLPEEYARCIHPNINIKSEFFFDLFACGALLKHTVMFWYLTKLREALILHRPASGQRTTTDFKRISKTWYFSLILNLKSQKKFSKILFFHCRIACKACAVCLSQRCGFRGGLAVAERKARGICYDFGVVPFSSIRQYYRERVSLIISEIRLDMRNDCNSRLGFPFFLYITHTHVFHAWIEKKKIVHQE